MNIVNITLGVDTQPCSSITLGRRGENEVTQVVVDFSSWAEEFGTGVITLLAMRSQDTSAYPVVLTLDGNTATWDVTSTDTAYKGSGRAEYIYTVGEQIAKSVVFNTVVMQDIGEPSETPPDPYEDWLERLTELGAETQANAEAAQQSAENAEQSAQEAAESAASVEGAVEQAEAARDAARAAQAASEAARDAAQTAQASAESSATSASGSATSAAGSATSAAGSASDASSSASAASASATTASTAATAAQTAQSAAEDAAEDAQQAAQQAHVEYEQLSGEVDDLSDEVSQQKSAIDDLTALTNRKAGALIDTASGAIASFVPDSTIDNLLGVSVDIEPVQDLHGYDSPWPAGGGKNIMPAPTTIEVNSSGLTVTDSNGKLTINGSVQSGDTIIVRIPEATIGTGYIIALLNSFTGATLYFLNGTTNVDYFSVSSANRVINAPSMSTLYDKPFTAYRILFSSAQTLTNATFGMMAVLDGADTTTFAPYENICPISGWDAVEVGAAGVNLLATSGNDLPKTAGGISFSYSDGDYIVEVTAQKTGYPFARIGKVALKAGTYTLSINQINGVGVRLVDRTVSPAVVKWGTNTQLTFTVTDPITNLLDIDVTTTANDVSVGTYIAHPMLNVGSTTSAYHPYAGNRYTIQLGQTVYGGTLDATAGTLTVDRAEITPVIAGLQSINSYGIANFYFFFYQGGVPAKNESTAKNRAISNVLKAQTTAAAVTTEPGFSIANRTDCYVRLNSTDASTVEEANAWVAANNLKIVYIIETPIVIQLDPVTISTISGQTNNVWADAGDVAVEYTADLKTYIDQKIAAAVAALS